MQQPVIWPLRGRLRTAGVAGFAAARLPADQQKQPDVQAPQIAPIVFMLAEARARGGKFLGVGPSFQGRVPLPAARIVLTGVTKDSSGAALGGCTVRVFRTADNSYIGATVSDAVGAYAFALPTGGAADQYFVVSYLAGAPDVAGTTLNTLTGSAT